MSNIFIICEGPTEKIFVDQLLSPYVLNKNNNVYLTPILIGQTYHKGGDVRYERFLRNFKNLRTPNCYISTLFDYFRIDSQWPGIKDIRIRKQSGVNLSKEDILNILNTETKNKVKEDLGISCDNFIPNFEMHEFEALLFSDVKKLSENLPYYNIEKYFSDILNSYCGDPEMINTNTAPSKIILNKVSSFKKTVDGINIAEKIGIEKMREECSCFNAWVNILLNLN